MKIATTLLIGLTLLAGFAAGAWLGLPGAREGTERTGTPSLAGDASLETRVARLEAALNSEREARQLLEDELFGVYDLLDSINPGQSPDNDSVKQEADAAAPVRVVRGDRAATVRGRNEPGARRDALTRAGFSPARADWILARESELRMEAMQARYDAMRGGEPPDAAAPWSRPESLLREEIGDAEYEMYLEATGRPTRVGINEVFASSPAGSAGIAPGDEITHYDGERVFSTADLVRETMRGEPGENVVVTVVRDGAPMQIVVPRGPLGVSTRWRR